MTEKINKMEKLRAIQFLLDANSKYLIEYFDEHLNDLKVDFESMDDEEIFILICELTREEHDLREIWDFVCERQTVDRIWENA